MLFQTSWWMFRTHLVGQLLVELLGDGLVQLSLEVPGRDPDSVDHLHQHEHDADTHTDTHTETHTLHLCSNNLCVSVSPTTTGLNSSVFTTTFTLLLSLQTTTRDKVDKCQQPLTAQETTTQETTLICSKLTSPCCLHVIVYGSGFYDMSQNLKAQCTLSIMVVIVDIYVFLNFFSTTWGLVSMILCIT